jgi:hypothetical protein
MEDALENSGRRRVDEYKSRLRVQVERELKGGVCPVDLIAGMAETLADIGTTILGVPLTIELFEQLADRTRRLAT